VSSMAVSEMLRMFCLGIREVGELALYPITLAVALRGVNRVVVGRLRLKAVHTHAKNRIGMVLVQPDVRFRRLAQMLRVGTVVHKTEMLVGTPGIVARPRDNGLIVFHRFEFRSLGDMEARGSFGGRKYLGLYLGLGEHDAGGSRDRQQ
jgi:hypothetical protein